MKRDIDFVPVKDVFLSVVKTEEGWKVYLLNRGKQTLKNVMVTSKGYGSKDGEKQETSILRHHFEQIEFGEYALIEPISPDVFHLNNEYWVSYYIGPQIFDKKYLFVPDSIVENNLVEIPELGLKGVLHQ